MVRKALNLLVDEDLVKKARDYGLNLSKFFENQLRGYFNFIEGRHQQYYHTKISSTENGSESNNQVGPPRY
jgi:DNA-binding GntR family transcriptional regulator